MDCNLCDKFNWKYLILFLKIKTMIKRTEFFNSNFTKHIDDSDQLSIIKNYIFLNNIYQLFWSLLLYMWWSGTQLMDERSQNNPNQHMSKLVFLSWDVIKWLVEWVSFDDIKASPFSFRIFLIKTLIKKIH